MDRSDLAGAVRSPALGHPGGARAPVSPRPEPARLHGADGPDLAGAVRAAAERLRAGGAALYPTETFYALGADPRSAEGDASVFPLPGCGADRRRPRSAAAGERAGPERRSPEGAAAFGHPGEREHR